jgi:hypothetical protein
MSEKDNSKLWWPLETWLKYGDLMRHAGTRNAILMEAFEAQRRPNVEYVVYERMEASYSNGQGGRPVWKRLKKV